MQIFFYEILLCGFLPLASYSENNPLHIYYRDICLTDVEATFLRIHPIQSLYNPFTITQDQYSIHRKTKSLAHNRQFIRSYTFQQQQKIVSPTSQKRLSIPIDTSRYDTHISINTKKKNLSFMPHSQ